MQRTVVKPVRVPSTGKLANAQEMTPDSAAELSSMLWNTSQPHLTTLHTRSLANLLNSVAQTRANRLNALKTLGAVKLPRRKRSQNYFHAQGLMTLANPHKQASPYHNQNYDRVRQYCEYKRRLKLKSKETEAEFQEAFRAMRRSMSESTMKSRVLNNAPQGLEIPRMQLPHATEASTPTPKISLTEFYSDYAFNSRQRRGFNTRLLLKQQSNVYL